MSLEALQLLEYIESNSYENISKEEANGNTLITVLKLNNWVLAEDEINILAGL